MDTPGMAAAAGKNVSRVFKSALLLCRCMEGVSVTLVWLAREREVNTLMLASFCFLLSGACLLPCPAMEGAGMIHGCGLGQGWQWPGSSSAIPGAGQEAAARGRTVGSLECSWVLGYPVWAASSSLSHVPTPLALETPRESPDCGFRDQIPCFQPHFQRLEAPELAEKEEA